MNNPSYVTDVYLDQIFCSVEPAGRAAKHLHDLHRVARICYKIFEIPLNVFKGRRYIPAGFSATALLT
jgi:hypothetical protein